MRHPIAAWFVAVAVIFGAVGMEAQVAAASPVSSRLASPSILSPWSTGILAVAPQGELTSVSCPTTEFCAAVDRFGNVLTYNGTSWSAPSLADPDTGGLGAPNISCASSSFCVVTDDFGNAVIYNGKTWGAPVLIDKANLALSSISCVSASFCVAVDLYGYAFIYNGTNWAASKEPIGNGVQLNAVSCASTSFCVAADNSGNAVTYNGTTWTVEKTKSLALVSVSCLGSTPATYFCAAVDRAGNTLVYQGGTWGALAFVDGTETLQSVSCSSTTACMAVDTMGIAFKYNGSTWSFQSVDPDGQGISSVSCAPGTAGLCAAGDFLGDALVYNSTWGAPVSVDPMSTLGLSSVSCPSTSFCAASDLFSNVLDYNGTNWGPLTALTGFSARGNSYISCASSSFCAAVNGAGDASVFNGTSWTTPVSIDASPNSVSSLSCVTGFCVAVDNTGHAIIYSGTSWSSPSLIDASQQLASVSCTSSSFCVAVDNDGNALTYGPTSWTAPVSIDTTTPLTSVSCTSSSFCAAADSAGNAMTFDGKVWTTPERADSHGAKITGLSCASPAFCVAVDTENYAFVFAPTTLTITPATAQSVIGQPVSVGVQVTSGVASRAPGGVIAVTDGVQSCTVPLSGSGPTESGACTLTEQVPGLYDLVATYGPNSEFGGSASASSPLTVTNANSMTTLVSSSAKVAYGNEQIVTVSVAVAAQYPGSTPAGSVVLRASSTELCSATLFDGTAKCTLLARQLPAGTYNLAATYSGSAAFFGSSSATTTLTVSKEVVKTTLALSASSVGFGHEQSENISVRVTPEYAGATPSGKVTVKKSTTTLCVISLSKGKGSCRLAPSKLPAGSYRLFGVYSASANFAGSASSNKRLTVTT